MRKIVIIILFISFLLSFKNEVNSKEIVININFVDKQKGQILLTMEDDFTKSLSIFDIQSRLQSKEADKSKYFEFLKEQVRDWNKKEIKKIQSIVASINLNINKLGLNLDFPDTVLFIKTTSKEEGEALGYTRANFVILQEDFLKQPDEKLEKTITHEFFHILTRKNPEFRKRMYSVIGFTECNIVEYPANLKNLKITNPDAPINNSYISLKNLKDEPVDCMMILYANKEYNGDVFFKYLKVGFLVVNGNNDNKQISYYNQEPIIYNFKEVKGFFEKVGKNTQYVIQPEEALADNFAFLILGKQGLPNPEIITRMKEELIK